jgi:hypothetical protein
MAKASVGNPDPVQGGSAKDPGRDAGQEGEDPVKESTFSKITAAGAMATGRSDAGRQRSAKPR